jgi:hypothetical protein
MLRNWVTQFGFDGGDRAGDERILESDRAKFIDQVGSYLGWNPPPRMAWVVEPVKLDDDEDEYILCFYRYATEGEKEKLLGKNYEKYKKQVVSAEQILGVEKPAESVEETTVATEVSNNEESIARE